MKRSIREATGDHRAQGRDVLTPEHLESLYAALNRRELVHPDPLEFVLAFDDPGDQEVAGLICACLAYGKVGHILASLEKVFAVIPSPASDLAGASRKDLAGSLSLFRHRWTTGPELADLLWSAGRIRARYGSLEQCFLEGYRDDDPDVVPALTGFVSRLRSTTGTLETSLLPCPSRGSACKRLLLYLRWMVRRDEVDPGPWSGVSASKLLVPMDTHMHRTALQWGMTGRRQADLRCARQVTSFFRSFCSEDPVRYDFALTRPGILGRGVTELFHGFVPAADGDLC